MANDDESVRNDETVRNETFRNDDLSESQGQEVSPSAPVVAGTVSDKGDYQLTDVVEKDMQEAAPVEEPAVEEDKDEAGSWGANAEDEGAEWGEQANASDHDHRDYTSLETGVASSKEAVTILRAKEVNKRKAEFLNHAWQAAGSVLGLVAGDESATDRDAAVSEVSDEDRTALTELHRELSLALTTQESESFGTLGSKSGDGPLSLYKVMETIMLILALFTRRPA